MSVQHQFTKNANGLYTIRDGAQRLDDAGNSEDLLNLFESIVVQHRTNLIYGYTNSGKSYLLRSMAYLWCAGVEIPGVDCALPEGTFLKGVYVDTEQPDSNLKQWADVFKHFTPEQRQRVKDNLLEITLAEDEFHNPNTWAATIAHAGLTHHDFVIWDSWLTAAAFDKDVGKPKEMQTVMQFTRTTLAGFDTKVLGCHTTKGAHEKSKEHVPETEGHTNLPKAIMGQTAYLYAPECDPNMRCLTHKKVKDTYKRTTFLPHQDALALEFVRDEAYLFERSNVKRNYWEHQKAGTSQETEKDFLQRMYYDGLSLREAIDAYQDWYEAQGKKRLKNDDDVRRKFERKGFKFQIQPSRRYDPNKSSHE